MEYSQNVMETQWIHSFIQWIQQILKNHWRIYQSQFKDPFFCLVSCVVTFWSLMPEGADLNNLCSIHLSLNSLKTFRKKLKYVRQVSLYFRLNSFIGFVSRVSRNMYVRTCERAKMPRVAFIYYCVTNCMMDEVNRRWFFSTLTRQTIIVNIIVVMLLLRFWKGKSLTLDQMIWRRNCMMKTKYRQNSNLSICCERMIRMWKISPLLFEWFTD